MNWKPSPSEFPWFSYIPVISRPWEDPEWKGEVGRVEDILRKYIDDLKLEPQPRPFISAAIRR